MTITVTPRRTRNGQKIYYILEWGKGLGERTATGIFTYSKPKSQLHKNQNKIIETIQNIFIGADERNWNPCLDAMDETVYLDYSSMGAGDAGEAPAAAIIDGWKAFLPRFKTMHHQLGNFTVRHITVKRK